MNLLLLTLLVLECTAVYFEVQKRMCVGADSVDNETYHFYYEATSKNDESSNITLAIVDKNGASLAHEEVDHRYLEIPANIPFTICFANKDS